MVGSTRIITSETVLITTAVIVISAVGLYWFQNKKKRAVPKLWKPVGTIKNLYIYPLKSGHRINLETGICTEYGLKTPKYNNCYQLCDRNFVVYQETDNVFQTARQYPKMIFIKLATHNTNHVTLDAPNMETVIMEIPNHLKSKETEVIQHKGERISTIDCGNEAAKWISKYILGRESGLRLGFHKGHKRRNITETHKHYLKVHSLLGNEATGMYSDLSSYLLINQASVNELSNRIPKENISTLNFRPNIVIEGENLRAYEEDNWKWVKIGDVILYKVRPCTRCVFTTINPETGIKSEFNEPLKTMRKYRLLKDIGNIDLDGNIPVMGVNMGLKNSGEISVGDNVYVGND